MKRPALVVMAAGMGSRYNGLKQIDPVGRNGEIIMDFSLFDAYDAGFRKVVFIIKKELEQQFKEVIGDKISKHMEVVYAFQDINDLPEGYHVPEGRVKPWGTGHAVLTCYDLINEPFAVINADDYYGKEAFKLIYDYLVTTEDDDKYRYAMVGYKLENTITEHGHVARGVCVINDSGFLVDIHERTRIEKHDGAAKFTEDGENWIALPEGSTVSMNMWGFTPSFLKELKKGFPALLNRVMADNPLKGEYFLPTVVDDLIKAEKAVVKVLKTPDKWYGVTYKEDKPMVEAAIQKMQEEGIYPESLWD